jgi:hypothetical protein
MATPGGTTDRGYGYDHQKMRRKWAPIVKRGSVLCSRYGEDPLCPGLIQPEDEWHLDHDNDRTDYRGPAHAPCNERAGAVKRWQTVTRPLTIREW